MLKHYIQKIKAALGVEKTLASTLSTFTKISDDLRGHIDEFVARKVEARAQINELENAIFHADRDQDRASKALAAINAITGNVTELKAA